MPETETRTREGRKTWIGKREGGVGGARKRDDEGRRKEGVRVRVRLGVGGAIRNYCGTIDKRRLRGRTTEDSLRPSDFPSTASPPFRLLSLLPVPLSSPGLPPPSTPRPTAARPCFAHEIFQTRQYVMFEGPRALRHPRLARSSYVEWKILPDLVYFSGRAEQTAAGQAGLVNTRYLTSLDAGKPI